MLVCVCVCVDLPQTCTSYLYNQECSKLISLYAKEICYIFLDKNVHNSAIHGYYRHVKLASRVFMGGNINGRVIRKHRIVYPRHTTNIYPKCQLWSTASRWLCRCDVKRTGVLYWWGV